MKEIWNGFRVLSKFEGCMEIDLRKLIKFGRGEIQKEKDKFREEVELKIMKMIIKNKNMKENKIVFEKKEFMKLKG